MSDFEISPDKVPGIVWAAEWHELLAFRAQLASVKPGLSQGQRHTLRLAQKHHSMDARELRKLLATAAEPAAP